MAEETERKERPYSGRAFNGANPFCPEKREPISRQWQPDKNLIPPQGSVQFPPQNEGKIRKTSTGRFGAREKPLVQSRTNDCASFAPFSSDDVFLFALLFFMCVCVCLVFFRFVLSGCVCVLFSLSPCLFCDSVGIWFSGQFCVKYWEGFCNSSILDVWLFYKLIIF